MLTKNALESNDDAGKDRLKDVAEFEKKFREKYLPRLASPLPASEM